MQIIPGFTSGIVLLQKYEMKMAFPVGKAIFISSIQNRNFHYLQSTAWAAARRAIGTRNGEQET